MAPLADDVWIFNAPMLRGLDRTVDLPQDRLQTVLHLFLMSKRFPTTAIEEILQRLSLQAALQRGWRLGTFNDIEESVLLVQENDEKVPVIPQVQGIVCKYKEISVKQKGSEHAVQCAWEAEYQTNAHSLLLENINAMERSRPYTNTACILQGSGSGKSRMVDEQAQLVFTLPFNLRPSIESPEFAFPPPDGRIRDYLLFEHESYDQLLFAYFSFFPELFIATLAELESLGPAATTLSNRQELASLWRTHLEKPQMLNDLKQITSSDASVPLNVESFPFTSPRVKMASTTAKQALENLILHIQTYPAPLNSPAEPVVLMIYFDEADVLTKEAPSNAADETLYDVLLYCLDFFRPSPAFAIFLSTNPNAATFAPIQPEFESARARCIAVLHASLTETPFDCSSTLLTRLQPTILDLNHVATPKFMANFGRPLFWAMLQADPTDDAWLVDFARVKLTGYQDNMPFSGITSAAQLAVLDIRLGLDFEPQREKAQTMQTVLVSSHMRTIYSGHKEYIRTGYPSEPLLAEAAAQQMNEQLANEPSDLTPVFALGRYLRHEFLHHDKRGDLVARLILTNAYDQAVKKDHASRSFLYSQGCSLISFITALLEDKYAQAILESSPDNSSTGVKFKDAYANAWVRFTHFAKLAEGSGVTSDGMSAAFIRCMAWIGRKSQHSVDVVIPILLDRHSTSLAEDAMSAIFIQVKRRKLAGTKAKYAIDQEALDFFPPLSPDHRPYVTIVMELEAQAPDPRGFNAPTLAAHPIQHPSNLPRRRAESNPLPPRPPSPVQHPRYSIFVYGCSASVYKGIELTDEHAYTYLLGAQDSIPEHPRQDKASLDAVRRLKPFWGLGQYDWIKNRLNTPLSPTDHTMHVGLYTGDTDGNDGTNDAENVDAEGPKIASDFIKGERRRVSTDTNISE